MTQTECQKIYGLISPRMLCAGVPTGERDACRVSVPETHPLLYTVYQAGVCLCGCFLCVFSVSGGFRRSVVMPGSRWESLVPDRDCQLGVRLWQTKLTRGLHQGEQIHLLDLQPYKLT